MHGYYCRFRRLFSGKRRRDRDACGCACDRRTSVSPFVEDPAPCARSATFVFVATARCRSRGRSSFRLFSPSPKKTPGSVVVVHARCAACEQVRGNDPPPPHTMRRDRAAGHKRISAVSVLVGGSSNDRSCTSAVDPVHGVLRRRTAIRTETEVATHLDDVASQLRVLKELVPKVN
jgi:hypothetical protein